jgi:CheY-like chemotaxis protein/HPt (histidine-containing phosphotransfer) domain-containing protein
MDGVRAVAKDDAFLDDIAAELIPFFIDDVRQKLDRLEQIVEKFVVSFERGEDYFELLRIVHGIKGMAGSFNFPTVGIIAHRLEDYLGQTPRFTRQTADHIYQYSGAMLRIIDAGRDPGDGSHAIVRGLPAAKTIDFVVEGGKPIETLFIGPKNFQFTIMESELNACGCHVIGVTSSFQGIEIAARTRPDLILVCNVVDILSGIEIARMLRTMQVTRNIPLLFIKSEIADPQARARLLATLPAGVEVVRKGRHLSDDLANALVNTKVI